MGALCTRGSRRPSSDSRDADARSNMLANPAAYFDALYGPSEGPNPSPYHPLARAPVRVPTLAELALEQLCVSLVDRHSLEQLLEQQQRQRRGALHSLSTDEPPQDPEAGEQGVSTPSTPLAAAVWATTPLVKGASGATRRYSHADALQQAHQQQWATPKGNHKGQVPFNVFSPSASALSSSPASAFAGAYLMSNGPPASVPPLKRARSLSLSSKESPELQPQLYQHTPGSSHSATHRMPLTTPPSPAGHGSTLQRSFSSVGSSPMQLAFASPADLNARSHSVPASPLVLGASNSASPHQAPPHSQSQTPVGAPPLQRTLSDLLAPHSMPSGPQRGISEPPQFSLPPPSGSVSVLNLSAGSGGVAHLLQADGSEAPLDGVSQSISALRSAGSIDAGQPDVSAQRLLRLPDSIVQLIFDRMIQEELLNVHNVRLFSSAHGLQRIDFSGGCPSLGESTDQNGANATGRYAEAVTDEWMHVLFESVVRHYHRAQLQWQQEQDERARAKQRIAAQAVPTPAAGSGNGRAAGSASPVALRTPPHCGNGVQRPTSPPLVASSVLPPVASRASLSTSSPSAHIHPSSSPDSPAAALSAGMLPTAAVRGHESGGLLFATSSPKLMAQTSTPHHGSIAHLPLERQASKFSLGSSASVPTSPLMGSSAATPTHASQATAQAMEWGSTSPVPAPAASQVSRSLMQAFSSTAPPHTPAGPSSSSSSSASSSSSSSSGLSHFTLPTLHNPLSVTSPSPSLALYAQAPALTYVNLSGCSQLTNRALMPLQLCLMLRVLNLNYCTQISDELLQCVLQNKFFLEELQLKGLRAVTDLTLDVVKDKIKIKRLDLDCTAVTDAGLKRLSALAALEHFSVGWCGKRVTDKGIAWLAQCFRLHTLCVASTGVASTAFFANLRLLKEIHMAGLKMQDGGLKQTNLFPHLRHAFVQRTQLREVPTALLHYHLHTLDLSFSSHVPAPKLLRQFTDWVASKPPDLTLAPISVPAPVTTDPYLDPADVLHVGSFGASSLGATSSMLSSTHIMEGSPDFSPTAEGGPTSMWQSDIASVPAVPSSMPSSSSTALPRVLVSPPPVLHGNSPSYIQVRRLVLESCRVSNQLCAVIGQEMRNLTELNVTDTPMTSEGLVALAPLTSLRILHISGCKVSNASIGTIGGSFSQLRDLYMDCETVSDAGIAALRPLAGTLRRLDIFEAAVGDNGLEHLLDFRHLRALECCSGRVTNAGLARLAAHCHAITSLNIGQNSAIDDAGVEALRQMPRLVHVNLSGTGVTHKGLASLSETQSKGGRSGSRSAGSGLGSSGVPLGCGVTPSLQRISLFGCDVKVGSAKLAQLPPGMQIGLDNGVLLVH